MNFPFSTFWQSPALAVPLQHTQQIWYPTHGPLHAPPRFSPSKPRTKRRHADSAPHDGQGAGAGTVDSSKAARPEARALYFDPPTPVAAPAAIAAPAMEEEELPAAEDLFAHVTFEPPQVAVELADLANQGKDMIREYLIKWYRYGLSRLCTESNDLWSKGGEPDTVFANAVTHVFAIVEVQVDESVKLHGFIKLQETMHEIFIDHISVQPDAVEAKLRLGTQLLHAIAVQFQAEPNKQMRLQHHINNISASALYTKLSFSEWGEYAENGTVRTRNHTHRHCAPPRLPTVCTNS